MNLGFERYGGGGGDMVAEGAPASTELSDLQPPYQQQQQQQQGPRTPSNLGFEGNAPPEPRPIGMDQDRLIPIDDGSGAPSYGAMSSSGDGVGGEASGNDFDGVEKVRIEDDDFDTDAVTPSVTIESPTPVTMTGKFDIWDDNFDRVSRLENGHNAASTFKCSAS